MKKTIYTDGIEVDASDLNNTEDTKIDEILLTRKVTSHFGVIEGLKLTDDGLSVTIGPGKAQFKNGEIIDLESEIKNVTGFSFVNNVANVIGLRLFNATSNPKPHEVDPIRVDTRNKSNVVAELFVGTEPGLQPISDATRAQNTEGNFIILGVYEGKVEKIQPVLLTPLPKTKAKSDQPGTEPSVKANTLVGLYNHGNNEFRPIFSAEDNFHRGLTGTGNVHEHNPHGLSVTDIGGGVLIDEHQAEFHSNSIIGVEPESASNFDTTLGSLTISPDGAGPLLRVGSLNSGDQILVNGRVFSTFDNVNFGTVNFTGKSSAPGSSGRDNLYYVVLKFSGNEKSPETDKRLHAEIVNYNTYNALCTSTYGETADASGLALSTTRKINLNDALEHADPNDTITPLERKFLPLCLVVWGGTVFSDLSTVGSGFFEIPNGLVFANAVATQERTVVAIPAGAKVVDLRRYGSVGQQQVQRRSIHLDRLVEPVTTTGVFKGHTDSVVQGITTTGAFKFPAKAGDTGAHLSSLLAQNVFGHRGISSTSAQAGTAPTEHPWAVSDTANNPQNAGFQSGLDKWKQDTWSMTILKWSDLGSIPTNTKAMGDAAAVTNGDLKGLKYVFARNGEIRNIVSRLGDKPSSGKSVTIAIEINGSATTLFTFQNSDGDGAIKNALGPYAYTANQTLAMLHFADASNGAFNLTVTAEFHYLV